MFTGETWSVVYDDGEGFHSTLWERTLSYAAIIHPCSSNPLGRYPLALSRARLAQRLVSPLWRHDHHDGFYRGRAWEEFGLARDVCDLSSVGFLQI
jgi:hypothetical protein